MSEAIVRNWVKLGEYDLETARAMLNAGRYLYVAFTCHQAIEKILKALFVKEKGETPPYTHNLTKLLHGVSIGNSVDEGNVRFMETLNSYYIETRYTEQLDELSKLLTRRQSHELYEKTEELFSWLKSLIK